MVSSILTRATLRTPFVAIQTTAKALILFCAGFTYSGDANSGNCYLKSAEGTYIPAGGNLVSAFRVGGSAPGGTPSSSSMGPVSTPNGGSCSALAAQNGTYTDENGRTYQVRCGYDYAGPNLATAGVSSYSKCFAACDAVKSCVSFSYLGGSGGGTCYLKGYTTGAPSSGVDGAQLIPGPSEPSSGSPTQSSTAGTSVASETGTQSVSSSTATSTATPGSGSCQQLGDEYTDASNRTYTVQCGFDHQGGDLKAVSSNSFQGCFPQCDATAGCVGFAYVGGSGPGTCYLKNQVTTGNANSNVDFAFTNTTSSSTSSQASGTATGSASSTVTGSESSNAPSATGGACATYTSPFTDANNQTYIVECGTDHVGGDLTSVSSPSFGECFSFCDKTTGCVGFAYVGGNGAGTCYLKSSIVPANSNPNVDFAYIPSAAPGSTSSSLASASTTVSSGGSSTIPASGTASSGSVTTSASATLGGSSSIPTSQATTSTITSPPKATSFSRSVVITTEGKTVTVYDDPTDSEVVVATSGFQGIDIPYGSTTTLYGLQHIALPNGQGIEVGGRKYPFDAPASSTSSVPVVSTSSGAVPGQTTTSVAPPATSSSTKVNPSSDPSQSSSFATSASSTASKQSTSQASSKPSETKTSSTASSSSSLSVSTGSTVTSPSSSQPSSKSMATVVTSSSSGSQSKPSTTGVSTASQSKASDSSSQTSSIKSTTSTSITTVTSPSRTTSQSTSAKPTTSSQGSSATSATSSSRSTSTSSSQVAVTSSKGSSSTQASLPTRTTVTSTVSQSSTSKPSDSSAPISSTRTSTASSSQAPATTTSSTQKEMSTRTSTVTTPAQPTSSKQSSSSAPLSSSLRTSTSPSSVPSSSSTQSGGTVTASRSSSTASVQPSPTTSCPELDNNYPFFLQSNVTSGNRAFHGLYVRKPPFNPAGSVPTLGNSWRDAAQIYYDVYKHLIAAKDDYNCNLYPFHLSPDDNNGPYGECTFADDHRPGPQARKNDRDGKVTYDDEFFGSWLACENREGIPELKFWQRAGVDEFDRVKCAKLELIAQNI
ncbi:hypothetical protein KC349_g5867 [Hortaea werneckii]|nr:hypothetical protein KC349_g5867 [Hortaea werneckii]